MDCPSRERAGWLCDSFFTSRVERLLTGKSTVEHSFLENFNMEESYDYLPEGMIPMCYPSDHPNENFIPNWAMWYGLEVKEYFERTGDREFIDSIKKKLYGILGYFRKFENKTGMLEKLEKWVFVEWSMCNKLVQDINYPTNMLYAMFKKVVGELYGDEALCREYLEMKETIRRESRMGLFFCDNAVYGEDGVARLSGERTEACQYYAFFTGIASEKEDKELWDTMIADFGPERRATGKWQEIHPSNLIVGDYMRCELLREAGLDEKLDSDVRGYFDEMAIKTGTLWEHNNDHASCNHGFASHALVWLDHLGYID
jgi:alpha-L-rhamnosidase